MWTPGSSQPGCPPAVSLGRPIPRLGPRTARSFAGSDSGDRWFCSTEWGCAPGFRTRFARSLVETGLIDEYRLVIHLVVLGAGERIFTAPLTIESVSTTVFSGGAVAHVFAAHP
jgi:hypothetical protein